jgi:5'-deoxynucleotidase YfbR-like HD superfamily hydrolase
MNGEYNQYPLTFTGKLFFDSQKIISNLHKISRTCWTELGVEDPETIGAQTDELVILAEQFFLIPDLTKMLRIHAWSKSDKSINNIKIGELRTRTMHWTAEEINKIEKIIMSDICKKLREYGSQIFRLWIEFKANKTDAAKIAHQLIAFQTIMKAIKYEKQGQPVNAQKFIDEHGDKIKNLALRNEIAHAKLCLQKTKT